MSEEVIYKERKFELVETRAYIWRVFENKTLLAESFSKRRAIIEAELKSDALGVMERHAGE